MVFGLLWVACIIVCVVWTQKRKKERERPSRSDDMTVNNQLEPRGGGPPKDNRDRDLQYECRKLLGAADRTCDGAEGAEELELEAELDEDEKRAGQWRTRGGAGLICTSHSGPVKAPHRTAYSPKDNRCKNLNAARLGEDVKDHYV